MWYILDNDKRPQPASSMEHAKWRAENQGSLRVGRTQITPEVTVSTVFLGLDHGWGKGPPILFETMIFGGPLDDYQVRYSSWDDAETGHKVAVRKALKCSVSSNTPLSVS